VVVEKKIILTDRSRMTTFAKCPRLAFWTYYWGGTGIVPKEEALPLLFGSAVHITLERLLVGKLSVEDALAKGKEAFLPLPEPLRVEQEWLFECLIRIWTNHRLPELRSEFDFLAVEKEFLWTLGEGEQAIILQMVTPDLLARRITDGELFYIEWKTTSYGDEDWARRWEKNTQVFCNALAIEETWKERIAGVMIEGLVKGPRRKELRKSSGFLGQVIQQSALCYGWMDAAGGLGPKWAAGSTHVPLWTVHGMTPSRWIEQLTPSDYLCPVPPITPDREEVEDWRLGAEATMLRIDEGLDKILAERDPRETRKIAELRGLLPLWAQFPV
jgi:hypothetical protein